jgi:hypothetical protein
MGLSPESGEIDVIVTSPDDVLMSTQNTGNDSSSIITSIVDYVYERREMMPKKHPPYSRFLTYLVAIGFRAC